MQITNEPARPEVYRQIDASDVTSIVQQKLPLWARIYEISAIRKLFLLALLALIWELYARHIDHPLLFPTFLDTFSALAANTLSGELPMKAWTSIKILIVGYAAGISIAAILTAIAINTRLGTDLLEALTSMLNPLPAIALLPLALLWFGLGSASIVFVIIHSVLWAVALNTHSGFLSVSETLRMVGRNYGFSGRRYVMLILVPAAFPSILTGLKIGWAFAWRTLIAAELVFGVSSGSGGLGWFIYENKNTLQTNNVFAGLFAVILIGLFIETFVFNTIEKRTVRRWGMQS